MKWGWMLGWMFFVLSSIPALGSADGLRFEMHTFMPSLELRLDGDSKEKSLDLKDGFGMRDINTVETKVYLRDNLRVSYRDFNYRGTNGLLRSALPELRIDSDLGLQYGGVSFIAPIGKTDRWEANWLFDLKGYSVDGQMSAFYSEHELLATDKMRVSGIAPTMGLMAAGEVAEDLHVYGEVSALPLGSFGSFWEADAGFQYRVKDNSFFHMGYRIVDLVTNNSALETSLHTNLSGPYFGLNYAF